MKPKNMIKNQCTFSAMVVMLHHHLWTAFKNFANPILEDIASFWLDWCKVKTLPKANWSDDDCFGFTCVMLYLVVLFLEEHSLWQYYRRLGCWSDWSISSFFTAMMYLLMCKDQVHEKNHKISIILFVSCCHRFCTDTTMYRWPSSDQTSKTLHCSPLTKKNDKICSLGLSWDGSVETSIATRKTSLKSAQKNPNFCAPRMVPLHKHNQDAIFFWGSFWRAWADRGLSVGARIFEDEDYCSSFSIFLGREELA